MLPLPVNKSVRGYLSLRYHLRVQRLKAKAVELQQAIFFDLVKKGADTEYGQKYRFRDINSIQDFQNQVPIVEYEELYKDINRMMQGEKNVLWSGKIRWFAKSSGTTNDRSKYIPTSEEFIKKSFTNSGWDALSMYYRQDPSAAIFKKKSMIFCGAYGPHEQNPKLLTGDVSSILLEKMPKIGWPYLSPDRETLLMNDWDQKIEQFVERAVHDDLTMISGVPSWVLVLFRKIKERYQLNHIHEIWPNLRIYFHGGVNMEPYQAQFDQLLPNTMHYMQGYNASEGYFAIQDEFGREDMLLLADHGIFYEFISLTDYKSPKAEVLTLAQVELGKHYVMVISTYSGLWRYVPGDTVIFTSKKPYRIQYSGRTKQHINMFGEELMIANADKALALSCQKLAVEVSEYTVAPKFFQDQKAGLHQWLISFNKAPRVLAEFANELDQNLQSVNSDYEAKRANNYILDQLELISLPKGAFYQWLNSKGKTGGQNKVPRLSNDRHYVESILAMQETQISDV